MLKGDRVHLLGRDEDATPEAHWSVHTCSFEQVVPGFIVYR